MTCRGKGSVAHYKQPMLRTRAHWSLLTLLLVGLALRISIAWLPAEKVAREVFGDDSFYCLNIARNIALGNGPTHDGVHPTNGYQPLWVFLLVPVFWFVHDKHLAVNIAATLCALFSTATALPLYGTGRHLLSQRAGLFAAFFWLFSPSVLRQTMNGMETGLYTFFIALSVWWYVTKSNDQIPMTKSQIPKHSRLVICHLSFVICHLSFVIGLLLGLTVLARVDGVLLVLAMAVDFMMRHRRQQDWMRRMVMAMLPFAALVSLWLIYSFVTAGALFPVSGEAVRFLSFRYLGVPNEPFVGTHLIFSLKHGWLDLVRWKQVAFAFPWLVQTVGDWGSIMMALPLTAAVWICLCFVPRLTFLLGYCVLLFLAYTLYELGYWFYPRYFFPMTVLGVLVGAAAVEVIAKAIEARMPKVAKALPVLVVVAQLLLLASGGAYFFKRLRPKLEDYYGLALWLNKNVPAKERVGVFQSGTVGYFCKRMVINLDGVVNSRALKAMRERRMLSYVASEGISHVADWEELIQKLLLGRSSAEERRRWELRLIRKGSMRVYRLVEVKGKCLP